MDRENILQMKALLDETLVTIPTEEDLDYDDKAIAMYDVMVTLRDAIGEMGF